MSLQDDLREMAVATEAQERAAATNGNREKPTGGLRITRASDVRVQAVEFLYPERVPIGAVTMLAGDPGLGKSTWSCLLAAGVTSGRYGRAATALIANAEDSPAHVIVPRLAAAGADLSLVEFFTAADATTCAGERPFELPGDVSRLEAHAKQAGARLVVIDPLNAHLGDDVSSKSDHSVRRALAPLAGMAQRLGIAVVVVAHLNKAAGTDAIYRVGGSIGLVGGARSLLVFTRDPDDPDGDEGAQRALGHVKSNWGRLAPTMTYSHEEVTVTAGGATVQTNRLTALGESEVAGSALLGVDQDDPPASQHDRAGELLADMLSDGSWHRSKDVKEAAKREGIADRTLKRAAHDAAIETDQRGFPRITWWRLSQSGQADGPTVGPSAWPNRETPVSTGDSGGAEPQLGHTPEYGPTGLHDLGPELADDSLADALPAKTCQCERPLPAPDDDGALRCRKCGRGCFGWGGAA